MDSKTKKAFRGWLLDQEGESGPIGDLARDVARDRALYGVRPLTYEGIRARLMVLGACQGALDALADAGKEYARLTRGTKLQVRVEVTQEHIDAGCRRVSSSCPIALALRGAGYHAVTVNLYTVRAKYSDRDYTGSLSSKATKFIVDFDSDSGHPVEPFEFDLTLQRSSEG